MDLIKEISLIEYLKKNNGELILNISGESKYKIEATTILGFKYNNGLIVASDGQATMMPNLMIGFDRFDKLIQIEKHTIIAVAGVPIVAWRLCKLLKAEIKLWNSVYENKMSTEGKINRLSELLRGSIPLIQAGLVTEPLFATLEINNGIPKPRIFQFEPAGTYFEREYHASGSGGSVAKTTLFNFFANRSSLPEYTEAVELAIRALVSSTKIDAATGDYFRVKIIDKDGVRQIENDEIERIKKKIMEVR